MLRVLLPVALSLTGLVFLSACPEPSEGEGEGEGEEGEGEGEGEGTGETCAEARTLTAGTPASGDTAGTDDDATLDCNYEPGASGDLFYRFELDADASVTLDLATEIDLSLALFDAAACDTDALLECADADVAAEQISVGYLPAGTYFVAVDGNDGVEGEFTLTLTVGAARCEGDSYDATGGEGGNETAQTSLWVGGTSIDTAAIDANTETPEIDAIDLHLCEGDVDYWLFTHLGGGLDVGVSTNGGESGNATGELYLATIDQAATLENGAPAVTGESGAAIPFATAASDLAGGYYLLKVSGSGATIDNPVGYQFAMAHECEPDGADSPIAALDDETTATGEDAQRISDDIAADSALALTICGGNDDALAFEALAGGSAVVTLTGGAALTATVGFIADGGTTEVSATNVSTTTSGANRTVTFSDLDEGGFYVLRVSQDTPSATTVEYQVTADFSYDPPANDTCANAEAITLSDSVQTWSGNNMEAHSEIVGLCNGDADVTTPEDIGTDVFYSFNVAAPTDLELRLEGTGGGYRGTITVYKYPGATCPTNLSSLVAVKADGTDYVPATDELVDVCAFGRMRLHDLPAGDYLAVADGGAGAVVIIFVIPPARGSFDLTAQTFPGGFPASEACTEATPIDLPAAGGSTDVPVVFADFSAANQMQGVCGGEGQERVFTFTPSANATVDFATDLGADGLDTVVYVRAASCEPALLSGDECNDDGADAEGYGSHLTGVAVTAGTQYFVVVDNYSALAADAAVTGTTLTVSVQ